MNSFLDPFQRFVDEHSRALVMVWAAFIGVAVRLVFEAKKKKITFWLFISRYVLSIFVGWIIATWLKDKPDWDAYLGPIVASASIISYEIVSVFINEVPEMISQYMERKFHKYSEEGREDKK